MKIVCPTCEAAYEVPAQRLVPGAEVRCARCATVWPPVPAEEMVEPAPAPDEPTPDPEPAVVAVERPTAPDVLPPEPEPEPALPQPAAPEPVADSAAPAPIAPASVNRALAAAWLLSLACVAAFLWAGWAFRAEVAHAWPPSERLYGLFQRAPQATHEPVKH